MTQLEFIVKQFITEHPRCTEADIMASFNRAPQEELIKNALDSLSFQQHIHIVPIQSPSGNTPPTTYYYPKEVSAHLKA